MFHFSLLFILFLTANSDFILIGETRTFTVSTQNQPQCAPVTILDDFHIEEDETIQVGLTSTDGAIDFTNSATIFITDDDGRIHCHVLINTLIEHNTFA